MRVRSLGLVWALLSLLCSAPARADDHDQAARAHFIAGEAHFAGGRYSEAARAFDEAYRESNRPEMLINVARAQERAGAYAEAIAALELLLSRRADMQLRSDAETTLTRLRVAERERRLEQMLDAPPPEPVDDAPALAKVEVAPTPPPGPSPAHAADGQARVRWPTLAVTGGAIASAVSAVATGWAAHAKYQSLEQRCPDGACTDQWADERAKGQRLARTSSAMTVSAVVLGGTAVALWVVDLRRSDRRTRAKDSHASARAQLRLGVRSSPTSHEATFRFDF